MMADVNKSQHREALRKKSKGKFVPGISRREERGRKGRRRRRDAVLRCPQSEASDGKGARV